MLFGFLFTVTGLCEPFSLLSIAAVTPIMAGLEHTLWGCLHGFYVVFTNNDTYISNGGVVPRQNPVHSPEETLVYFL